MGKRIGAFLLAALLLLCAVPSYAQELILEEPVLEEPVSEESVLEEPILEEPVSEEPALDGNVSWETVLTESAPEETNSTEPPLLEIESVEIVETKETEEPGLLENCVIQVEETLPESGQAGNASFSRLRAFSAAAYTDSWGAPAFRGGVVSLPPDGFRVCGTEQQRPHLLFPVRTVYFCYGRDADPG